MGVERGMCVPIYSQQRRYHLTCLLGSVCVMCFWTPARVAYFCLFRKNKGTGDVQPFRWPHQRRDPEFLTLCSQRGSSLYSDRGWWFPSEVLKAPYYTHFSFVMSLKDRDVVTQLFVTSAVGTGSSCIHWWDSDAPNSFLHFPMHWNA